MDAGAREPWIPDFTENSPWRWEWWKVGLAPEDLFTKLEAKYNTVPYRIQGDEAFHHDVSDAAHKAKNIDDFYTRLALRRDGRLQELRKAWDSIALKIICSPSIFGDDLDRLTHWLAAFRGTSDRVVAAGHRRGQSATQPARLDPKSAAAADTSNTTTATTTTTTITTATPHHATFVAASMADQACWCSEETTTRPPVSTARF
ncbi:hypothetical protein C7999DRAFT_36493 [Corynascus novoguineensis]|uniref:Uncharacterized protein n=1 Tax=Corynascus novoguineensis TaxID=1126955 RepID=A0AAN7HIH7_9PEZI|nr:hypothetical protein C7999DRAFT_36493 [Corynascus novoguineensis]